MSPSVCVCRWWWGVTKLQQFLPAAAALCCLFRLQVSEGKWSRLRRSRAVDVLKWSHLHDCLEDLIKLIRQNQNQFVE